VSSCPFAYPPLALHFRLVTGLPPLLSKLVPVRQSIFRLFISSLNGTSFFQSPRCDAIAFPRVRDVALFFSPDNFTPTNPIKVPPSSSFAYPVENSPTAELVGGYQGSAGNDTVLPPLPQPPTDYTWADTSTGFPP